MSTDNVKDVKKALEQYRDLEKATFLTRFFKTGKGEYAEGDQFWGIVVPQQRKVAKQFTSLSLPELSKLIKSPIHEHRLTGLFILRNKYERSDLALSEKLVYFYLKHLDWVNNWDLVDSSASYILGDYLFKNEEEHVLLKDLSNSGDLWRERVSIIATFRLIKEDIFLPTLVLVEKFLTHPHDLIHKATGWMLREIGKRKEDELISFLDKNSSKMPRTMLRYAIEKLSPQQRTLYLSIKRQTTG